MKRVSEQNGCVVSDLFHQDAKTDEKTKKTYAASTRVTIDFMGGQHVLPATDENFKCETNKSGIATIEEELMPVRYDNKFRQEKNAMAWVPVAVLGFKVSPSR